MSAAAVSLAPALAQLAGGGMILLTGDRLRDGDIDFVLPARAVSAAAINFMALHGRGLICLALTPERALRLGIGLINSSGVRQSGRPFGQSIEAKEGVDTGISAADRAHTIAVAVAETSTSDDIVSPGHVFPLITRSGGVRERQAAAEAAVDLCRLAGMGQAAVLCSVMRSDGTMARVDDMRDFAAAHAIPIASIDDLLARLEESG
jgi:3,4-dihydroxy 2-butanone 4-phosphate synthase/GTP cyclohydrolase II